VDAANPAYSSSADGVVFDKEKTCLVVYPSGKTGSYVIPNSVTTIRDNAFTGCDELTAVTIPDHVTRISHGAFFDCGKLASITIPDSVKSVEDDAFSRCSSLVGVTIPAKVANIGNRAFVSCPNLKGVYVKGNAPRLGQDVFKNTPNAIVYYLPGTTGWGKEFGGRPTAVWGSATVSSNSTVWDGTDVKQVAVESTSREGTRLGSFRKGQTLVLKYEQGTFLLSTNDPTTWPERSPDDEGSIHRYYRCVLCKMENKKYVELAPVPGGTKTSPFQYQMAEDADVWMLCNDAFRGMKIHNNAGAATYRFAVK